MLNVAGPASTPTTRTALKEWAVAVKALEEGRAVLILRKGGIHEKRFPIEHREFLLYPTYDHQRPDLLKPPFHSDLREVLVMRCPPGLVRISSWARATDVWEVSSAETLAALSPHVMWSDDYAAERLRWRPTQPLRVVALRVYRLPEPRIIPVRDAYGGCLSWLEVEDELSLDGLQPVLDDAAYERLLQPIRHVVQGT
jgi:hypothetical protein